LGNYKHALMMGTEMVLEMLAIFNQLTRLTAQGFINGINMFQYKRSFGCFLPTLEDSLTSFLSVPAK
jgi:hypothetical protein